MSTPHYWYAYSNKTGKVVAKGPTLKTLLDGMRVPEPGEASEVFYSTIAATCSWCDGIERRERHEGYIPYSLRINYDK